MKNDKKHEVLSTALKLGTAKQVKIDCKKHDRTISNFLRRIIESHYKKEEALPENTEKSRLNLPVK